MAKHMVKCPICGLMFDANAEPYVMINSRRYAHQKCQQEKERNKTQEEKDKDKLESYIKEIFGYTKLPEKVSKQIKHQREQLNYSYSAIYKTLKYWFEVKHGDLEKANGGIGIVPWVIEDARNYWLDILEAKELNKELVQKTMEIPVVEVHILPPKRAPIRQFRKKFTFLEEGNNEQ